MKKIFLLAVLSVIVFTARAQFPQNFDMVCGSTANIPGGWANYCPSSITPDDSLNWHCSSEGRNASPGMRCTGYYNGSSHLDTAYLITPLVYGLSSLTSDQIYLSFDTKTSLVPVGNLDIIVSTDSSFSSIVTNGTDVTQSAGPTFGNGDLDWTTHQINLTYYEDSMFYVAFRYTSDASIGSIWYIDNILFTPFALSVTDVHNQQLPLTVVGNSTPDQVKLSYTIKDAGICNLSVTDMMGRRVYSNTVTTTHGTNSYNITGLHLTPGMYFIKMENGSVYGAAKAVIE